MVTELGAADSTLDKEIDALEVMGSDFESVVAVLDVLAESDDIYEDQLIKYIREETILANLPAGYTAVKTCNGLDQQKLENFLVTELYPNYNDQQTYLNI